MSFQAMAWAVKQKTGDAYGRALLMTLANYADDQGRCWPSLSTLADDCEMHRASVIRKLEALCEMGLISREQKKTPAGTYNVYTLSLTATPSRTEQPVVAESDGGSRRERRGVVAQCDPNLLEEPIKEPITGRYKGTPKAALMAVVSEEMAEALVEARVKLKKPMTSKAAEQLAKRLAEYHDPEAGAARMLERGWTGFNCDWMHDQPRQRQQNHDRRSELLEALDGPALRTIDGELAADEPSQRLRLIS